MSLLFWDLYFRQVEQKFCGINTAQETWDKGALLITSQQLTVIKEPDNLFLLYQSINFLGIVGMQLNSLLSLRVVYLNTEWLFHEALLGLSVYFYYVSRCRCRSFYPSLCRLSWFLLFYVTVSRSCCLSEFYLKRAFFIPYLPLLKSGQPVCLDDFMGPKILIKCVFKLKIKLYWSYGSILLSIY